jgi:CMP-N,N'-diacetyllegionaminic acid synthase
LKFVAIILARGGSKSVPNKNIRNLNGLPLIAHSIILALECNIFDQVVVSSDNEEILSISKSFGALTIKRPIEFAQDYSTSESAIIHAINELGRIGKDYDAIVLLEPTSPLRTKYSVIDALQKYSNLKFTTLISVVEDYSTFWRKDNKFGTPLFPNLSRRRQDRAPLYREAGVIYISSVSHMLNSKSFISERTHLHVCNPIEAIDINSEADFLIAEALFNHLKHANNRK